MANQKLKNLLLLDGIGALISAFLLGVVLVHFQSYFGIPKETLYILAIIPCFFGLYDFYCRFILKKNLAKYLQLIAIANMLYCLLSLTLAFAHAHVVTSLGWIYIIGEIIIVGALALYEFKVSRASLSDH